MASIRHSVFSSLRCAKSRRTMIVPSRINSKFRVSPTSFATPSTSGKRLYSSREQAARDRDAVGPATWRAGVLFILAGGGLYFYFESEKQKVQERRAKELKSSKSGRPKVGGPFSLLDQDGKTFTEQDLMGNWSLVYFGFTNCPDICPEELDKMGVVVDSIEKHYGADAVKPVFISVDPARDSVEQVKKYLEDFHPQMVGLTGTYDAVKSVCKSYRVYFSTPPDTKAGDDYLVDHSIYFYLMDPEGQFAGAFGKATTAEEVKKQYDDAVKEWKEEHPGWQRKVVATK
ncbi:Cu-binding protein [Tulasnella sp. JGI-2019a]|nr:Cu-binding protein [Tulasnella sp. JGI-2019a]KAG9009658.1 Cu-binding protein [Tulasnella sp. JGI-2019a]